MCLLDLAFLRSSIILEAVLWLVLNATAVVMNVLRIDEVWFLWFAPLLLLGYLTLSSAKMRSSFGTRPRPPTAQHLLK